MSQGYSACTWSLGEAISGEKCNIKIIFELLEILSSKWTLIAAQSRL